MFGHLKKQKLSQVDSERYRVPVVKKSLRRKGKELGMGKRPKPE